MTVHHFDYIAPMLQRAVSRAEGLRIKGRVVQVTGTIIRAAVPSVKIGEICYLKSREQHVGLRSEVVGFAQGYALLMPLGDTQGISNETEVLPTGQVHMVPVGPGLLGRIVDGMGDPLDEETSGPLNTTKFYPVICGAPDPLKRRLIEQPLSLGIRALDGLLTCGEGQRLGVFAAAGGGKSTLLGMLVKNADVDVTVVALIGERGREVREFLEHELGEHGRRRAVIVCATSDKSSMERSKAAFVATAIAEYFRDQGKRVLFLMDSVTRFARAQREISLAAGEPPTRRGFPPSVFATLPKLMERVGMGESGSITALYTVLVEGDDTTEPIADETRSILDGHIVLSRKLGAANHYPAIDILASVSRVVNIVASKEHRQIAGKFLELMAKYEEVKLLVKIGEYKHGSDPVADQAILCMDKMRSFLRQQTDEHSVFEKTISSMKEAISL